jgi:hypothetical protein
LGFGPYQRYPFSGYSSASRVKPTTPLVLECAAKPASKRAIGERGAPLAVVCRAKPFEQ